jgi:predicted peptidase
MKYLILMLLFLSALSFAKVNPARSSQFHKVINKADYPFYLYLPKDSVMESNPPVIIFLHGRSLSGNNLDMLYRYGVLDAIDRGLDIPAIIIAPQVRAGESWSPDKIYSTLKYVQKNYSTDTNRVYVFGMSLGGYGTFDFAGAYPDKITAAIAMCGGGKLTDIPNLSETNLWVLHGRRDVNVPFSESEKIVKAIRKFNGGSRLKFTEFKNYGHSELARMFYKKEMYDWLFSLKKQDIANSSYIHEVD